MERAVRITCAVALLVALVCMAVLASEGLRYTLTHHWGFQ